MSTLSSANVTDVNLLLKERTHMRLCINMLIFTHNLGNWLINSVYSSLLWTKRTWTAAGDVDVSCRRWTVCFSHSRLRCYQHHIAVLSHNLSQACWLLLRKSLHSGSKINQRIKYKRSLNLIRFSQTNFQDLISVIILSHALASPPTRSS